MTSNLEPLTSTIPYAHQVRVIERSKDMPYFAYFLEMGTGKTLVAIANAVHLYRTGKIEAVIVLAPNGIPDAWERNELPKHLPPGMVNHVATWHSNDGKLARSHWNETVLKQDGLVWALANIESLRTEAFWSSMDHLIHHRRFLLIIDESTVVKNPKAQQAKLAVKLGDLSAYARILTGTPVTQSPMDLWMQCRVLHRSALPFTSFIAFKHEFAIEETVYMGPGRPTFQKIIGYKNQEKLSNLIAGFSERILKKDCLDLPDKVYRKHYVELTVGQKKAYKDLSEKLMTLLPPEGLITVTSALGLLLRLHQIVLGYLPNDIDGKMVAFEHNRTEALLNVIAGHDGKHIIFCRFLADIDQVVDALQTFLGPESEISIVRYTGAENQEQRHYATTQFQDNPACQFFVCTSAAARGLNLTAASSVIYYSQGYSLDTRLQSEDRAHRLGQKNTVVYTDLLARDTVEESIVAALQAKKDIAAQIIDRASLARLIRQGLAPAPEGEHPDLL